MSAIYKKTGGEGVFIWWVCEQQFSIKQSEMVSLRMQHLHNGLRKVAWSTPLSEKEHFRQQQQQVQRPQVGTWQNVWVAAKRLVWQNQSMWKSMRRWGQRCYQTLHPVRPKYTNIVILALIRSEMGSLGGTSVRVIDELTFLKSKHPIVSFLCKQ